MSVGRRFRHWLLETWLLYAVVNGLAHLVAWLPLGLARALGRLGGRIAYVLDTGHRKLGLVNLALAFPEKSPAEHRAILKANYVHLGVCAVEFCRFLRLRPEDLRGHWVTLEDGAEELMRAALAEGHGLIVIGGHIGAWELSGLALPALGFPLACVARRVASPRIDALVMRIRSRTGNQIVYQEKALRHLFRALRKGQTSGMHMDQYAGRQSPYVPLFGREASTVEGAGYLHLLTGAPIMCGAMLRRPGRGYVWRCRPVPLPPAVAGQSDKERVRAVLAACNRALEEAIREAPEQWLWFHNRWRDHRGTGDRG